jgi:hypothetical protein
MGRSAARGRRDATANSGTERAPCDSGGPARGWPCTPITLQGYQADAAAASEGVWGGTEGRRGRSGVARSSETRGRFREMIPPDGGRENAPVEPSSRPKPVYSPTGAKGIYPPSGAGRKGGGELSSRSRGLPPRARGSTDDGRSWGRGKSAPPSSCRDQVRVGVFLATSIPGEAMGACLRGELLVVGVRAPSKALMVRNADRRGVAA